ncbi:MAG: hypothetical protein R2854_11825 [Caldilineaceae bacterium]
MLRILLSIAPIFLLIVLGYGLRRRVFTSVEFWSTADRMVYWLLFPAPVSSRRQPSTCRARGNFAVVIYCVPGAAVLFALIAALHQLGPAGGHVRAPGRGAFTTHSLPWARPNGSTAAKDWRWPHWSPRCRSPTINITVVTLMVTMLSGRAAEGCRLGGAARSGA